MISGLAPDGGLFRPEHFPQSDWKALLDQVSDNPGDPSPWPDFAHRILRPYFAGDGLEAALGEICKQAFSFAIPLKPLPDENFLLELFHGPTAAFKDVGAGFLAASLSAYTSQRQSENATTILVATSGDTGGAVAAAFSGMPNTRAILLFPHGGVSSLQQRQLTCWGENIHAFAVKGDFDKCQALVKQAFSEKDRVTRYGLISANSINLIRILPQMVYYAYASLLYFRQRGEEARFVVPTGNLGNATAGLWARAMGFPIASVQLALNANAGLSDYLKTGTWKQRASVKTLANAMDVASPSNLERLEKLFPSLAELKQVVGARSVSDAQIRDAIVWAQKHWGETICPHTATACAQVMAAAERGEKPGKIVLATAHAAKFSETVEPLLDSSQRLELPPSLKNLWDQKESFEVVEPGLDHIFKT